MEKKELQNLAYKVQLEIKEEEIPNLLEMFRKIEKLTRKFKRLKGIQKKNVGAKTKESYLTLQVLKAISKQHSDPFRYSLKNIKNNAKVTKDNFILLEKGSN